MNTNMEMFLVVAQEMNLTYAAEKLFTSPQNLSYHIRQLEADYNAVFFNRTPRLSLTPAGERMLFVVQQIKSMEDALRIELSNPYACSPSTLSLMMPESRFPILAEPIIRSFHALYPNIALDLHGNTTSESEKCLLNGSCDIFIGLNPSASSTSEVHEVLNEKAYIVGRHSTFQAYLPEVLSDLDAYQTTGISLSSLRNAPIILNHVSGVLGKQLDSFLHFQQIQLNTFLRSNNADLHIQLCRNMNTFCICPGMFLCLTGTSTETDNPLLSFPIQGFPYLARICIVRRSGIFHSKASDDLVNIIKSSILNAEKSSSLYKNNSSFFAVR